MTKPNYCHNCDHQVTDHGDEVCWVSECDCDGLRLWGDDGPTLGQVITIAGTSMQTRWNGHSWELVDA